MQKTSYRLLDIFVLIGQRLASGILVLLAIMYLTYFGLDMARGTPSQQAIIQAGQQTITYLGRLSHGDFGETLAGSTTFRPVPVMEVVPVAVGRSLGLLAAAMLIAISVGIVLGVWASRGRHSKWSLVTLLASIIGVSAPSFFAALLLQMAVIKLTRITGRTWLPVGGYGWDAHLLLPALVLAARPLAQIARVTFVTLNEVFTQDYVRTAYSKGLTDRLVMISHVIRNAAVPVLTTIGISLRFSLSSLPLVEYFFSWQGMGFTLLKSISQQDDNLTIIFILILGGIFILVNLLLDLSYRLIDPRLRSVPEHIARGNQPEFWNSLRGLWHDVVQTLRLQTLRRWWLARKAPPQPSSFRKVLDEHGDHEELAVNGFTGNRRAWLQGTLGNLPLMVGIVFVVLLLGMIVFAVQLSPHSPYTTRGLQIVNGEFFVPPFAPDETYPWGTDVLGRDMMSLIIAGAQQTLFLAMWVMIARILIGFTLGAIAGWLNGSWLDRLLLGLAEVLSAFPTLLLAMTFILALGIHNGIRPFVIALSFVGWGEIMQFVRSEVLNIRPKVFIESAIALGSRTPRIILHHVLPNLIPALISLAALEMGAVLMLLGELGFIGIFIGGGAFAELDIFGQAYHYSDIPEWGALLSNVRLYARTYPWTAIYPSLAFFVAILGFNLLGEGLRRLVETVGARVMRLFNRYSFGLVLVAVIGFLWVRGSTGALAYYQEQASQFDAQQADRYLQTLTLPGMEGRALDTTGQLFSAMYMAQQFEELGIQAAGENFSYYQPRKRSYEKLDEVPELRILDGGTALQYHQDYVEFPSRTRNLGSASGKIRVIGFRELMQAGTYYASYPALVNLDVSKDILMVLSTDQVPYLDEVPRAGLLVVTDNPLDLQRRNTLSPTSPLWQVYGVGRQRGQDTPQLWISEQVADRLLAGSGETVADLRKKTVNLGLDELIQVSTETAVEMTVKGTIQDRVLVNNVIGHWPGQAAGGGGDAQSKLDDQMIVVMAQYDAPPLDPTGEIYSGANDNASALAVMLETIRTMQATGYQPYKSILFVAYSGEGYDGGAPAVPEVAKFLQTKYGFSSNFTVEAVINLRGLGGSEGDAIELQTGGSLRLANLFENSAKRMGVPVKRARSGLDISVVFSDGSVNASAEEAPIIGLTWADWQQTSNSAYDTLDNISIDHLDGAGRTLSLALMILGKETDY
jgi:ABC-type dipeptide/oligopeptide/nickel transport system permease component